MSLSDGAASSNGRDPGHTADCEPPLSIPGHGSVAPAQRGATRWSLLVLA